MERFEVKGVYGLKFFYLAEDEQPFYTQWYSNGKDVVICGTKLQMLMTTTVLCALKSISKEKLSEYSVRDCVSSGTTNSAFSILLFQLVYRSFLLK